VPAQQGVGLYEVPPQASAAEETTQSREQCTVRRPQRRANHLATEDRNLVTQHDDFDSQPVAVTPAQSQQFEDSDESEVEERQGLAPFRRSRPRHESPVQATRITFSAPTRCN
jgi:hypothetical protein